MFIDFLKKYGIEDANPSPDLMFQAAKTCMETVSQESLKDWKNVFQETGIVLPESFVDSEILVPKQTGPFTVPIIVPDIPIRTLIECSQKLHERSYVNPSLDKFLADIEWSARDANRSGTYAVITPWDVDAQEGNKSVPEFSLEGRTGMTLQERLVFGIYARIAKDTVVDPVHQTRCIGTRMKPRTVTEQEPFGRGGRAAMKPVTRHFSMIPLVRHWEIKEYGKQHGLKITSVKAMENGEHGGPREVICAPWL